MAKDNITVNYDDERFGKVESDKNQAMTELENVYGGMIDETDKYYEAQINASKEWADTQSQLQQEQTDFAIEQIEQQKNQAHKDYVKEQSGAYVDWQKQSNQYGVNAEQIAGAGLTNTGFSETSQVNMYTAYQNRVAVARDAYSRAVLNYDNAIKDARLQNNAALAEIAYQALQQQLELSLEGFQYKNQLILDKTNQKIELDQMYYNRYLDVLNQINTENAMREQIRQFEMEYQQRIKEFNEGIRQFNEEIARLKAKDAQEYALEIQQLELQKQQLAEEKRQFDAQYELQKSQISSSGSGGGGGSSYTVTKDSTTSTSGYSDNVLGASDYYNKLIASGYSQTQILAEITSNYKDGAMSTAEYNQLKEIFNPRGVQYT